MRLHQASAFYGVASTLLGGGRIQEDGPEAGLGERADQPSICAYYDDVLTNKMLASERVEFFAGCEYVGDGAFISLDSGERFEVSEQCRIVDARYVAPDIPAESPPKFGVADDVRVIPPNDLVRTEETASEYVIVGSGKTATDSIIWLLAREMRQRCKIAAALVSDPRVLVLDEPLNGADPVQRVHLIALFKRLGAEGRTVIVSSHVLNEVERLAQRVIVLIHGRLAAAGGHHAIRDAMDDRPRHVFVRADDGRSLAASFVGLESVAGVTFDVARGGLVVQTGQARELATALPGLARDSSIRLLEVRALDDSLESLFRELVR